MRQSKYLLYAQVVGFTAGHQAQGPLAGRPSLPGEIAYAIDNSCTYLFTQPFASV